MPTYMSRRVDQHDSIQTPDYTKNPQQQCKSSLIPDLAKLNGALLNSLAVVSGF